MNVAEGNESARDNGLVRRIPTWVFAAVIVLCLAGGGVFVAWYLKDPPTAAQTLQLDTTRINFSQRNGESVARVSVEDNVAEMTKPQRGELRYSFYYSRADWVTAQQSQLGLMRWRIINDANISRTLRVSVDQMAKLKAVPSSVRNAMEISEADLNRWKQLWEAYEAANQDKKRALEPELGAALKEIGDQSLAATKKRVADRAELITKIMSAEQIKSFGSLGSRNEIPVPVIPGVELANPPIAPRPPATRPVVTTPTPRTTTPRPPSAPRPAATRPTTRVVPLSAPATRPVIVPMATPTTAPAK